MKQNTSPFPAIQFSIEPFYTQLPWRHITRSGAQSILEFRARFDKALSNKEFRGSPQAALPITKPAPLAPCFAPFFSRSLRLSPFSLDNIERSNSEMNEPYRIILAIEFDYAPSDTFTSDVEAERVLHANPPRFCNNAFDCYKTVFQSKVYRGIVTSSFSQVDSALG
jgi:hypothetical protein